MSIDDVVLCKTECEEVIYRYAFALDRGANADAADLFTADGINVHPDGHSVSGTDLRAEMMQRSGAVVTRHIVTNVMVTPTGDGVAKAQAYVMVYRAPSDAAIPRPMPSRPRVAGEWLMEFRRTESGWRISRCEGIAALAAAD